MSLVFVQDLIQRGDLIGFQQILASNPELVYLVDDNGYNSILLAVLYDELEIFKWIEGIDSNLVNSCTSNGMAVLHICVLQSSNRVLEYLGHGNILRLDIQNKHGETPLHLAAAQGNASMIRKLLDFNCTQSLADNWGRTPVDVVLENGYSALAGLFDAQYISRKEKDETPNAAPILLNQNKNVISEFMTRLKTKADSAVDSSKVLVRHIFEDTVENVQGGISEASSNKIEPEPTASVPAVPTTATSAVTSSVIRRISISQQIEFPGDAVRLSEMVNDTDKYDINGRDMFGWTALHKVCLWHKTDLLEILLSSPQIDTLVLSKNRDGFSALHCCVEASSYLCAERLKRTEKFAELLDCVDAGGRTARQYATERMDSKMLDILNS